MPGSPAAHGTEAVSLKAAGAEANAAFERYLKAQGEGRFSDAAAALSELQELLARFKTESDNVRERDKVPEAP